MRAILAIALFATTCLHAEMRLSSTDINSKAAIANDYVFQGFGCNGKNISPQLSWSGAPKDAKSFAVLVHDPDAPTGGAGWWHWVVYNIPATASGLARGAGSVEGTDLPPGSQQNTTDFGAVGWGGPCPPAGDKPHRYIFTVHALKVEKLDIAAGSTASLVGFMVNANSLAKATLTAKYGRK
jgi:Raf kinase inhibitor-like YbhB/YbcL family protein